MARKEVYRICNPNGIAEGSCPDDPFQVLAAAIVEKAVEDYCNALAGKGYQHKPAAEIKAECECFFRSNWFMALSPLDGEIVIQKLSTGCVQRQKEV